MSVFYIWNPTLKKTDPPTVDFIVTSGDGDQIGEGSPKFYAAALKDVGVDAKPWKCDPLVLSRSSYYSDEPKAGWEDRWRVVWRARATLKTAPKKMPMHKGPVGTDADDETFSRERHWLSAESFHCLVVADFATDAAFEKARSAVAKLPNAKKYEVQRMVGRDCLPQLQVDLGERPVGFFEDGATEAEKVIEICCKNGGAVWHESGPA